MTTLIAVYTSQGCVGRCDAKCYEALTPVCDCICNGRNHGRGLDRAVANTRELAHQWLEEYAQRHNLVEYTPFIAQECLQSTLWDLLTVTTSPPSPNEKSRR